MKAISNNTLAILILLVFIYSCSSAPKNKIESQDLYPWCIVAYDSLERSPSERINMLKQLGFEKYAYDWRDKHLDNTLTELNLATENDIEIISVWLWLNAKRDSLGKLSLANERFFDIIKQAKLKTTIWVSLSENFFKDLDQEKSLERATDVIRFIAEKAEGIDCKVALYNHTGWFGNPFNQLEIIKNLPQYELSMVYNFHHGHNSMDEFHILIKAIKPYLSAVNLNGMEKDGHKILAIGKGNYEKEMIQILKEAGFKGPWGILGHVKGVDVEKILKQNIEGLKAIEGE
ncbi:MULTISPECIES: sugar phosphate isomerase/epimerase family protein [unclassified Saccharicrinis]|uniref:sugar phosphate isomerase/epimerase family protein n=1 Tax=unclassified Saccharicrinis TaxID=2646859 RepID=UPI003D35945D